MAKQIVIYLDNGILFSDKKKAIIPKKGYDGTWRHIAKWNKTIWKDLHFTIPIIWRSGKVKPLETFLKIPVIPRGPGDGEKCVDKVWGIVRAISYSAWYFNGEYMT